MSKFKRKVNEALEEYENKIENAIADLLNLDENEAKQVAEKMEFQDYLNFALYVEKGRYDKAREIVGQYGQKKQDPDNLETTESIAEAIHYFCENEEENVVIPQIKKLSENRQREVIGKLLESEQRKVLANLRGFKWPGHYELSLFEAQRTEEIINQLKNSKFRTVQEVTTSRTQDTKGSKDTTREPTGPDENETDSNFQKNDKVSVVDNEKGQAREGEVVSDKNGEVTVRTDRGTETVEKKKVYKKTNESHENHWKEVERLKNLAGLGGNK